MTTIQPPERCYEDEVDLREIILTLWQGKWTILLVTLSAIVVALALSMRMPKQYQAEAHVALRQPKLRLVTLGGLSLQAEMPDPNTVAAVAQAPNVFQRLSEDAEIQEVWRQEEQPLTWQTLARCAEVKVQDETGLLLLFKDTQPQRAALVANRWAVFVVGYLNNQYGWGGLETQLEPRVQQAWKAYQDAEATYLRELGKSQAPLLEAQWSRAKADLACLLGRASRLSHLQSDVAVFMEHLETLPLEASLSPGDALALVALQQQILAPKACTPETARIQVEWPAEALSGLTVQQARELIQELKKVLAQRSQVLPEQQKRLEEEVRRVQKALEEERAYLQEVRQPRDAAWHTYQALLTLRSQEEMLNSPENAVAFLSAQATVPEVPVSPQMWQNVILAMAMGMVFGGLVVLVKAWLQGTEEVSREGPVETP